MPWFGTGVGRRPLTLVAAAAVATVGLVAGCGTTPATAVAHASTTAATSRTVARAQKPYDRIFEIVMENLSYGSATGYSGYQSLAHKYATATDAYAASHPSLPNYLDLTGGSTFGINSDCESCYINKNNLGMQLENKHVSWGDYSEGVPGKCFLGSSANDYAGKHNPFRYYQDIRSSKKMCNHLMPLTTLQEAMAFHPSSVPHFVFVTPNLCHDGHDCSPTEAFAWLAAFIGSVVDSRAWTQHNDLLIVTWDEGDDSDTSQILPSGKVLSGGGGGHIPTFFFAPGVPAGTQIKSPVNLESLLATVEHNFGLPYLLGAQAWSGSTLVLP